MENIKLDIATFAIVVVVKWTVNIYIYI